MIRYAAISPRKLIFTLAAFFLLACPLVGQVSEFHIKNLASFKDLRSENYIELILVSGLPEEDCETCAFSSYGAVLLEASKDSITLEVHNLDSSEIGEISSSYRSWTYTEDFPIHRVHQDEILYAQIYKSPKAFKRRTKVLRPIGGILVIGGILTGASGLIVADGDSRTNVVWAGVAQFVTGITLAAATTKPKRYFKNTDDPYRFGSR